MDLQNECVVPYSDSPSGGSHYSVAVGMQPNLMIANGGGNGMGGGISATVGSATTSPSALSSRKINSNSDMMCGEDGRINFSNNKNQSHATRHVVNMLGKFVYKFINFYFSFEHSFSESGIYKLIN